MNRAIFHIYGLLYPARCPLCLQIVQRRGCLCADCDGQTDRIVSRCTGCGCPVGMCECGKNAFGLNLVAPFEYSAAVRKGIQRFKFHGERQLSEFFGDEMSEAVKKEFGTVEFDFAACVPQRRHRARERSFNQAALLAKRCAKNLGIPAQTYILVKLHDTADQHSLKAKERLTNVKGAFAVTDAEKVKGKTVLLCDDIKTTGATLNECRKALLAAGAKEVYCAAIAVTTQQMGSEKNN